MIKVTIDTINYNSKPNKKEIMSITKRLTNVTNYEHSIETIAKLLVQPYGRTFSPAVFKDNKRSNATWVSQQLFGLDFDEGITVEEVLSRCNKYGIIPCFIYSTFSSVNNDKFRVFFCNDTEITDYRMRTVIQLALMRMFKESDKSCKDGSRLFFGGQKLLHEDYDAKINPVDLLRELCRYIYETDKVNAAREIKSYCQSVGLDMVNGIPKVLPLDTEKDFSAGAKVKNSIFEEIRVPPINTILYIGHTPKSSKNHFLFSFSSTNTKTTGNDRPARKFAVVNEKLEREELIQKFSFSDLEDNCKLYKDFTAGDYWAYHLLCENITKIQ